MRKKCLGRDVTAYCQKLQVIFQELIKQRLQETPEEDLFTICQRAQGKA